MLERGFEYELNGVLYKAAPMDDKYKYSGEPLRPSNAQLVQGQSNLFNLRPDLLRWKIDSWAGGQGQYAFDGSRETNDRYWKGFYVDGFTRYGVISPGWGAAIDETPTQHLVVQAVGSLWAIDAQSSGTNYKWDGSAWTTTGAGSIDTTYVKDAVAGDDDYLYFYDGTSGKIYKDDTAGSITEIGNTGPSVSNEVRSDLKVFRDFILLVTIGASNAERGVWQLSKSVASTTALTQIYDMTGAAYESRAKWATAVGPNRLYVATPGDDNMSTYIHEIIPDDASATGYGYIRATIPGVVVSSMWYSNGFIWIVGRTNQAVEETNDDRGVQIVYLDLAQSTFGTLSSVYRDADDEVQAVMSQHGGAVTGSLSHFNVFTQMSANVEKGQLFQIDQSTGGVQLIGERVGEASESLGINEDGQRGGTFLAHEDSVFYAEGQSSSNWGGILRWGPDLIPDGAYFITSWYEFGLDDDKSLSSVELVFRKAFSSDWDVKVYYQGDDDTGEDITGWTLLGTMTGDGSATSDVIEVSSASSQVTFKRIRFAVLFDDTGTATDKPELTSVTFTAQVAKKFRVREVWLSLTDEQGLKGRKGNDQITNIKTVGNLGTVVNFKDGMVDRTPGVYESTDVLIDAYQIILEKPGEGVAYVRMLESY